MTTNFRPGRSQDAYALFRGLIYQVQHTILAWMDLSEGNELELEYGEDIDHILSFPQEAQATGKAGYFGLRSNGQRNLEQIKYRERNLTLRSSSALKSLIHFYQHIERNRQSRSELLLTFSFTTNASIGEEAAPNSAGAKYLEIWNELHNLAGGGERTKSLKQLRDMIASFSRLSSLPSEGFETLQNFFKSADDGELIEFVRCFRWNTEAGGIEELEKKIAVRCLEPPFNVAPSAVSRIYTQLFFTVFNLLADRDRPRLSRELLQRCIIDRATIAHNDYQRFEKLLVALRTHQIQSGLSLRDLDSRVSILEAAQNPVIRAEEHWTHWQDFFRQWLADGKLFHHQNQLIGRADQQRALDSFLNGPDSIALVVGAGGMGKSKLLLEMARENEATFKTVFLEDVNSDCLFHNDMFSPGRLVLVVDDAHRCNEEQLSSLIGAIANQSRVKLVLATRPCGTKGLRYLIRSKGIDHQSSRLIQLAPLSVDDAKALSTIIVGAVGGLDEVLYLVSRANGIPMLIVGLAEVWKRKKIPLALAEQDDAFEADIMGYLADGFIAELPNSVGQYQWADLLAVIAANQPFRITDDVFINAAASFLEIKPNVFHRAVDLLADQGVVAVGGRIRAVKPDLIAERFLRDACLTQDGVDTHFAKVLLRAFAHNRVVFFRILGNVVRLNDFAGSLPVGMLAEIWEELRLEAQTGPTAAGRIIDALRKNNIPAFAPKQTLAIVDELLAHFESLDDCEWNDPLPLPLRDATQVLQQVACHPSYCAIVSQRLWKLGRNDKRTLHNHLDHGLRGLHEVIEYYLRNYPPAINDILETVQAILSQTEKITSFHHPLVILKPVFENAIRTNYHLGEGKGILTTKVVIPQLVAKQWKKALALVEGVLRNEYSLAARTVAFEILEHALVPHFVAIPNAKPVLREKWLPLRAGAMVVLENFLDSLVEIRWHPKLVKICTRVVVREREGGLGPRAAKLLAELNASKLGQWHRALRPWSWRSDFEPLERNFDEKGEIHRAFQRDFVTDALQRHPDPVNLLEKMEAILTQLEDVVTDLGDCEMFCRTLVDLDSDFSRRLCHELIIAQNSKAKERLLGSLLRSARQAELRWVIDLMARLADGDSEDQLTAAKGLVPNLDIENHANIGTMSTLLHSQDSRVREAASAALSAFIRVSPESAMELIESGRAKEDGLVWLGFFRSWLYSYGPHGVDPPPLTRSTVKKLIKVIERYPEEMDQSERFSDYFIESMIPQHPWEVFEFILRRFQSESSFGLEAVYFIDLLKVLADSDNVEKYLRAIAQFITANDVRWHAEEELAKAYWILCKENPTCGMDTLTALMKEAETEPFDKLMAITEQGPVHPHLEAVEYMDFLLSVAREHHVDNIAWVRERITGMIVASLQSRSIGEPNPALVEVAEKLDIILSKRPLQGRMRRLYLGLKCDVIQLLENDKESDEEFAFR